MARGMKVKQTKVATQPLMMNSLDSPIDAIQPTIPNGTPMEGRLRINVTVTKASAVSYINQCISDCSINKLVIRAGS